MAFDPGDTDPSNGTGFGDIWGIFSIDNGETWSEPVNISNPGGTYPGTDDRYPSLSPANYDEPFSPGMDAYIVYQTDNTAGTFVQGEEAANWDHFLFTGIDFDIPTGIEGGERNSPLPWTLGLSQNYPNPFNPATTVRFRVAEGEHTIDLSVFDSRGRFVTRLLSGNVAPGEHEVTWNGRSETGESAASDVYFLRMKGTASTRTITMLLMK